MKLPQASATFLGLAGLGTIASAADITLTAIDAVGTTSYNTAGHWSNAAAPSTGNDYFVSLQFLRTPGSGSFTFGGDSLTIQTGGAIITKNGGVQTLTQNLILNGGYVRSGSANADIFTFAGTLDVTASGGFLIPDQSPFIVNAPISGDPAGTLTLANSAAAAGFAATGPGRGIDIAAVNTFTGNLVISTTSANDTTGQGALFTSTSSWKFAIGSSGSNNTISGAGNATFDGAFEIDTTLASSTLGDQWNLVTMANKVYGTNFSVTGWTQTEPGVWWDPTDTWRFTTADGILLVAPPGDSDGDGILDSWEQQIIDDNALDAINTFADVLPGDDYDNDGLTNREEYDGGDPLTYAGFSGGTSPIDNDSDDDDVLDGAEVSGSANVNFANAATNPLVADSDGDTLNDGAEITGSANTAFGNAPTNPNAFDTDGDFYRDNVEITAGTNPNSAASLPGPGAGFHLVEDFEGAGMTIGETFAGVNGWAASDPLAATVADEPLLGGDQVGQITGNPNAIPVYKNLDAIFHQIPQGATGTLFFQVYVAANTVNHSFGLSDVAAPVDFGSFECQFAPVGANLLVRNGALGALDTGYDTNLLAWSNVWIVADNANDTCTVYVETPLGESGQIEITNGTPHGFRNGTAANALNTILFLENSAGNPLVLVDNIYLAPLEDLHTVNPAANKPDALEDSDNDGLADVWEFSNFGSLVQDGAGDPDGDCDPNELEETNGTDPNFKYDFTDTDDGFGDGLPDTWEVKFFGNITAQDGDSDLDEGTGDGLDNYGEFDFNTNPNLIDTDGDGLSDGDEANVHFTDPLLADQDQDGLNDSQEIAAGTNPAVADSDGDNFGDGYEVANGSLPNDAGSLPSQPTGWTLLEDFEGEGMVAGTSYNGVNGWTAGANSVVAIDPAGGDEQVGCWAGGNIAKSFANQGLAILDGNTGSLFFQAYIPSGGTYDRSFTMSDTFPDYFQGETSMGIINGNIFGRNPGGTDTTFDYPVDQWFNVWMIADAATDRYDLFMESPLGQTGIVQIANDWIWRNSATLQTTALTGFVGGNFDASIVYIDNLYVDATAANATNPLGDSAGPVVTNIAFSGGNLKITFSPGGAGYTVTSSNNLSDPFTAVPGATFDGVDTFTIPAAALNPGKDFFRIEEAP